jgi:glutamate N-acetyltransferase / amino-acid N-acetyltransferase
MRSVISSNHRINDSRPVLPIGFKAGGVHCGLRFKRAKLDLGLIVGEDEFPAVAVFTQNQLTGVHFNMSRDSLARTGGYVRAILVNAGMRIALQAKRACWMRRKFNPCVLK